ncbi:UNVERIFIED_CONTAM: Retrovirus-related Pol polyprotein from transposon TNT 1-94 [Sesamum latifolium]|uniref:Retrovirus-related Pol polyprotein from transposon TNT 1-94 n=1 Tax=Sesamum latifolium TaxID=2727402 RepID=A0AAW2XCG6_9LAMI
MVRSMMSLTELPPSFWGYALETAAKLLNIAPLKTVPQTPYEIWHGKPTSYKYLGVWGSPPYVKKLVGHKLDSRSCLCRFIGYPKETIGYYFYDPSEQKIFVSRNAVFLKKSFPSDSRRDEVLLGEPIEEPRHDSTTSFEPLDLTDGVPVLRRSTRESRAPERYGFIGLTSQLDNDPNDIQKSDLGADAEVTAFKARLVAKEYTQQPGVDFEETYLPIAMVKPIRILLAIAIWDLYGSAGGFHYYWRRIESVSSLRSIYGLKQASQSWKTRFDKVIRGSDFIKNEHDPCIYKKISGNSVAYLVLYVDDILLIRNDVKVLVDIKAWLSTQFSIKDMGEASYILGIKIYRDRSRRMSGLTQSSYFEKVLKRFKMKNTKRGYLPMRHGVKLSKKQSPKIDQELKRMSNIPYASAVGSIQYAVQCTRPNVAYALSVTSRYQGVHRGGALERGQDHT